MSCKWYQGFNPCFNGCRSAIYAWAFRISRLCCFNPCFNGCRSAIAIQADVDEAQFKFQSLF